MGSLGKDPSEPIERALQIFKIRTVPPWRLASRNTTYSQNPLSPLMIPAFPSDATIASIHMACIRVGRLPNVMSSVREIYGLSGMSGTISNGLGYKAAAFVEQALASTIEPSELIRRHSMFPLLSSVVTKEAADSWCQDLASGAYSYQQHPPATRPCAKVKAATKSEMSMPENFIPHESAPQFQRGPPGLARKRWLRPQRLLRLAPTEALRDVGDLESVRPRVFASMYRPAQHSTH